MKHALLILALFPLQQIFAQEVSLDKNTILVDATPVAHISTLEGKTTTYTIYSLDGEELMELHNARVELKGKPAYVVTFLGDSKQALVALKEPFPLSFIKDAVAGKLITGKTIASGAEAAFVKAHPLPKGYIDIDQLIEY